MFSERNVLIVRHIMEKEMEKKITRATISHLNPGSRLAIEMREKAAELQKQADELLSKSRLARGTRENVRQAKPVAPVQPHRVSPPAVRSEWWVGDEGPTGDLLETVQRMLTGQAHTFREIKDATGAGDNRIKGVLMRMQREGINLVNVGTDTRALWTIMTPEAYARIRKAMAARAKKS